MNCKKCVYENRNTGICTLKRCEIERLETLANTIRKLRTVTGNISRKNKINFQEY